MHAQQEAGLKVRGERRGKWTGDGSRCITGGIPFMISAERKFSLLPSVNMDEGCFALVLNACGLVLALGFL